MLWYHFQQTERFPAMLIRSRFLRYASIFASVLILVLPSGCSADPGEGPRGDLFSRIRSRDAAFTLVLPSATNQGEDLLCAGERSGDRVVLAAVSPERSAGLTAEITMPGADPLSWSDPRNWTVTLTGPGFPSPAPVDPEAALFLRSVCSLLYGPEEPGSDRGTSELPLKVSLYVPAVGKSGSGEGEEILLSDGRGTLVLSPDGMPVRLICADLGGNRRTVRIEDYRFEDGQK